jgi:hypothetical protein
MGKTVMRLIDYIAKLEDLDEEKTLYVAEPWTKDSLATALHEPDDCKIPEEAKLASQSYFLELFILREFLTDWEQTLSSPPTKEEKCLRAIDYAKYDA